MKTREAFNANTQQIEEATVTIDNNGDYLFTFEDGSFFKLPGTFGKEEIDNALEAHQTDNEGKITLAQQEAINALTQLSKNPGFLQTLMGDAIGLIGAWPKGGG